MILSEIIQRIQSLYSHGVQSDDSRLTPRHIYNKILTVRSKLISQQAKKKQKVNQWNYQTLPCIALERTSLVECPCIPPMGCDVLKSKYRLPKPLSDYNGHLIQSVTTVDGSTVFSEINFNEIRYKGGNRYTSLKPDYFIRNEYLYILAPTNQMRKLKVVTVTGLFEDPLEVLNYPSACEGNVENTENTNTSCISPLDMDFPLDSELIETLIPVCSEELIALFNQNREDLTNNSTDSLFNDSK